MPSTTPTDTAPSGGSAGEGADLVDATTWLVRLSIDLRGVRPSAEELAQVEASPEAVETLLEAYLEDPRLPERLAWVYDDTLQTAVWFQDSPYRYFPEMTEAQGRAAGWEPLALVEEVIREDLPWSHILLSPYLLQSEDSAGFWQRPSPGGGGAWLPWTPADGRPMAGLLSSDSLWLSEDGDRTNFNRRRANAVARMFVCADLLERDLVFTFDLDASNLAAMETAIRTEPGCTTCHAVLDPLAAFFGGFAERSVPQQPPELGVYAPWSEEWYRTWRTPAWFGRPGYDLADLGQLITADPRFPTCTGRRLAEGLIGAPVEDLAQISAWGDAFVAAELRVKPLVREIVRSPAYRSSAERVLRPNQLATVVADLLAWTPSETEDLSLLAWSNEHRLLGGDTDDVMVLQPNAAPGVGHHLLQTWMARRAVVAALETDRARPAEERILFTALDPETTPSEAEVRTQLAAWHTRFLSLPVSDADPAVDRLLALYTAAEASGTPGEGWEVALAGLLRHPRALVY